MKSVVIGPGRIGCGCAGQLLRASGHEVCFIGRNPEIVDNLNRLHAYGVRLADGVQTREIAVDEVRAVRGDDRDAAVGEIAGADLIVTAVGAGNLPAIAPLIAEGLRARQTPVNVLAFENLADAGSYLKRLVASQLPPDFPIDRHGISGAVVMRAVTQRFGNPARAEPLVFLGDPITTFAVSGPDLRPPLPEIQGMIVAADLCAWMKRKLYIFSAGHATCAYLGYLKGYHYIHTAIRDPEIRSTVLAAMREGQRGLAALYGPEIAGSEKDLLEIVARFENAALEDTVIRVGRDPVRKLAPEDRLLGAARLARKAGVRPEMLGLAAAAALCFDPDDPSSAELQHQIETIGLGPALHLVTGLDARRGIGRLVERPWIQFVQGWQKDNVLLSLKDLIWTWKPRKCRFAVREARVAPPRKGNGKNGNEHAFEFEQNDRPRRRLVRRAR